MAEFLHRASKAFLRSTSPNGLPEQILNYIQNPDLSAVGEFASKYWIITGDSVALMSRTERDALDAADLSAARDARAGEIDQVDTYTRAFALVVLAELNVLRGRAGLPDRTINQLKTAVRNKLDV